MISSSPPPTQKPTVSLVIPGRNCAQTLEKCLNSVVPLLDQGELQEILFVDDGSTDNTAEIARRYPVQVITGTGGGPGAARNLGWRQAKSEYIWFIDSDCVAEPDALQRLIPHLENPEVAGAGGSYANLYPDSLLATLIHEEIIARHRRMPLEVNFLGGFNVLYRRTLLDELNGFDESETNGPGAAGAEDCDFSFRAVRSGHLLHFEFNSRVGHHHPRNLLKYLKTQAQHGRFRVQLYLRNRDKIQGDSYANGVDYIQPPLAIMSLAMIPLSAVTLWGTYALSALIFLLLSLQSPMLCSIRTPSWLLALTFIPFGFLRAYARGIGMTQGMVTFGNPTPQQSTSIREHHAKQNGVAS
ncbi:Hyaluronan synthase [Gimesia chilikensis]|uniref:Hyaluronan synthase n=1 Tax=Gimesia chilikensis TaxID=2605989 RepID=A0A517WGQ3_9PLAN|nr:glycosyltransferase [Gimesia chilikensis]QDU04435.1 Hyaluronan synthase [Gimesia chilikensis]